MNSNVTFLVSILYMRTITKVAVLFEKGTLSASTIEFPLEDDSRAEIYKFLPMHISSMGPVVDVERIHDVLSVVTRSERFVVVESP